MPKLQVIKVLFNNPKTKIIASPYLSNLTIKVIVLFIYLHEETILRHKPVAFLNFYIAVEGTLKLLAIFGKRTESF